MEIVKVADFETLVGNQRAKEQLTRMLTSGRIGNSLLFAGPDGIGKGLFAHAFAKAILCKNDSSGVQRNKIEGGQHPDIHIYRPEGKIGMHSIASMRQFIDEVHLPPYEGIRKVFILHEAERMLPDSANALLKTFEEPSLDSLIILLSSSPESLLPTITSRCQTLLFQPIADDQIAAHLCSAYGLQAREAEHLAFLSRGSIARALTLRDPEAEKLRKSVLELLSEIAKISYPELLKAVRELNELMEAKKKEWGASNLVDKNASPIEKEAFQKEQEGIVSLKTLKEAEDVFEVILAWHRDLHLIASKADSAYLIHRDYQVKLQERVVLGGIPSLEVVMRKLADAKMAFTRSISFQSVMETLFLNFART